MRLILFFFCCLFAHVCLSQDFNVEYPKARTAYKNRELETFHEAINKAVAIHPYHQGALYYAGISAALKDKPELAVSLLKKAILIESRYDSKADDLKSLFDRADYKALVELQQQLSKSLVTSDTALVNDDRQLHVEGVAYNPDDRSFYLGSVHKRKVVKVDANGAATDFVKPASAGLTSVFGLRVDKTRKFLWVCSSPVPQMQAYDSALSSGVFKYDIRSGKLLNSYLLPKTGSVFGDIIIDNSNNVFVSDGGNNTIYYINERSGKIEEYFSSPEFMSIQGLTFSDDNSKMYIADYVKGIFIFEIKTKKLSKLENALDLSLKGVDGLYYYKGSLIVIQNGVFPFRVVQVNLNSSGSASASFRFIDRAHPAFNEPTLGVMDGNVFYYVANSQWGGYDDKNQIKPSDQLQKIIILKANLDK